MNKRATSGVFIYQTPPHQSFFARLFGKKDPRGAFVCINNLLAEVEHPSEVDVDRIEKIHDKYGATIADPSVQLQAGKHYAAYLKSCFTELERTELRQRDIDDLQMIQYAFKLSDKHVDRINLLTGQDIYRRALLRSLSDDVLTQDERKKLKHLGHQLNLDDADMDRVLETELQNLLNEKLAAIMEDGEFSPEEELDLKSFCKRFDISPVYSEQTQKAIDYAKLIWHTRHDTLVPIQVDISLKAKEECYARISSEWWEVRRMAVPIWRSHHLPPEEATSIALSFAPIVEDSLEQIDTGVLYITNKRIVFIGRSVTTTILYSKMVDMTQYQDGVKIIKETGRSPYILGGKALYWGSLVRRLLFKSE